MAPVELPGGLFLLCLAPPPFPTILPPLNIHRPSIISSTPQALFLPPPTPHSHPPHLLPIHLLLFPALQCQLLISLWSLKVSRVAHES
jgi:hypothetical protein